MRIYSNNYQSKQLDNKQINQIKQFANNCEAEPSEYYGIDNLPLKICKVDFTGLNSSKDMDEGSPEVKIFYRTMAEQNGFVLTRAIKLSGRSYCFIFEQSRLSEKQESNFKNKIKQFYQHRTKLTQKVGDTSE